MRLSNRFWRIFLILCAVAFLGALEAWWSLRGSGDSALQNTQANEADDETLTKLPQNAPSPVLNKGLEQVPGGGLQKPVSSTSPRRISDDQRQQLLADILQKLAQSVAQNQADPVANNADTPPDEKPEHNLGTLDKEYIRQQIKEIIPLVKECYDNALAQGQKGQGKIAMSFSIIADPELGGLIEESQVQDKDPSFSPDMLECMRETMYAIQFEAPKNGGRVKVSYPFVFRESSDE